MKVIKMEEANLKEPLSLAIGFFDGLHTGHQALIADCIKKAKELNIKSGLITFDPDPWKIFFPDRVCRHITTLQDRIQLASSMGIEVMYVITFSKDFSLRLSAPTLPFSRPIPQRLPRLLRWFTLLMCLRGLRQKMSL